MTDSSSNKSPKVSVLMTIYNAEPYLKEAIDSIMAQDFEDWELIAVENGSSDLSATILASYQDKRIRAFNLQNNIGRTPALRYAFEQARGEYTAVLDADDVSRPDRLTKQAKHLDKNLAVGLVGSWGEYIDKSSQVIGKFEPPIDDADLRQMLGWANPFVHSSIMYRSRHANEVGGYPANYSFAQDCALILAIARTNQVCILGENLCRYRVASSSMTSSTDMQLCVAEEQLRLLLEASNSLPLSEAARSRNALRQAVTQVKIGVALLKGRRRIDGARQIAAAFFSHPSAFLDVTVIGRAIGIGRLQ